MQMPRFQSIAPPRYPRLIQQPPPSAPLARPFGEIPCAMAVCSAMERARSDRFASDAMTRNQVEDQCGGLPKLLQKALASFHSNGSRDSLWPDP